MDWLLAGFARVYAASQWMRLRFTRAGEGVLALCVAAGVLGVDTQRSMGFQVFALCAALLLVAWFATLRGRGTALVVQRELPRFATAGIPFSYRVRVRNAGGKAVPSARLREALAERLPTRARFRRAALEAASEGNWVDRRIGYPRWLTLARHLRGGDIEEAALPALLPGTAAEAAIRMTPLRRGTLRFAATHVVRPDPLGLLNAIQTWPASGELVVLPPRYPVPPLALPGARRLQRGGVNLAAAVGESEEFVQLRDYRPGDALRHIHWRSFARLGKPVVKEYQDEYFTRYALALDTFGTRVPEASFEAAVSVAASLVATLDQQDALLDLMFVEDRTYVFTSGRGLGEAAELLRVLAAVEPAEQGEFARLAHHVLGNARRLSGCIVILLELDEARREFLERLRPLAHALVLLVAEQPPARESGVTWIDPRDVAGSLGQLKVVW
jgi:uncharacterized protein (DUF58 family)